MAIYFDYYNTPIELWRGVLEEPTRVKDNVLCYQLESHKQQVGDDMSLTDISHRMGVTYSNLISSAKTGRELHAERYCGVMFGISRAQFWNLFENGKVPTQWALLKVLCYMALKSIAGNKSIARTNNAMMFARMAGFANVQSFDEWEKQQPKQRKSKTANPNDIRKYFTRYYAEKLRREIEMEYDNFKAYSTHVRGFVFTFEPDVTLTDVIFHAKSNTEKEKTLKYHLDRNKAEREALERLRISTSAKD